MKHTIAEEDIFQITDSVWNMILGFQLVRCPRPLGTRAAERTLAASVQIDGAWEGVVSLHCSANLASRAAAVMFGLGPGAVRPEQVQDALGELTNMVGGNIEALLPEPCTLSVPTVIDGTGFTVRVPGRTRVHSQVALESSGDVVVITLLQKD